MRVLQLAVGGFAGFLAARALTPRVDRANVAPTPEQHEARTVEQTQIVEVRRPADCGSTSEEAITELEALDTRSPMRHRLCRNHSTR